MNENSLTKWEEYKKILEDVSENTKFTFTLSKTYSLKFAIDVFYMGTKEAGIELGYPKTAEGVLNELYKEVDRLANRAESGWMKMEFDKLSEKIFEELIEEHLESISEGTGFSFKLCSMDDEEIHLEMHGDNPCGEDWVEEMELQRTYNMEDFDKELYQEIDGLYENFDMDDYVELWLTAKHNGVRGVPGAVDLVNNAEYEEAALEKFSEKMHKIVYEKGENEDEKD